MAKITGYLPILIGIIVLVDTLEIDRSLLSEGRTAAKLLRIKEGAEAFAALLKNLEIKTAADKLKFVDAVNELTYKTQKIVYEINQAIPSIQNKDIQSGIIEVAERTSMIAENVQHHLHQPLEQLKQCLVENIERSIAVLPLVAAVFQRNECKHEVFLLEQMKRVINEAIYAFLKIKLQTEFFHKTNKELEKVIDAGLETFCTTLQAVKNNVLTRDEFVHLVEHLERVQDLGIVQLQSYVSINADGKTTDVVKEVAKALRGSCGSFTHLFNAHDVVQLKADLEKMYKFATAQIKKLAQIDEKAPGDLYLRSILFDSMAITQSYERELNELNNIFPPAKILT